MEHDYRIERWAGCKAYHVAGMRMDEVDPAAPMLKYIARKLKLDIEQKLWLAWLYATCYSAPTAYYMMCHASRPEFLEGTCEHWWQKHKPHMVFETDRLRVKTQNQFPAMYRSYRQFCGSCGCISALSQYIKDSPEQTYDALYGDLHRRLYYFGRYSLFMYLEAVYNLTKLPIMATGLDLKDARSSRNGLCYATDKDTWVQKRESLASWQYDYLQGELARLFRELVTEYPDVPTTYWNLETSLCAYKKLFWQTRYVGYYIDRQQQEIRKMETIAPDCADWSLLWQFRREHFDSRCLGELNGWRGVRTEMMSHFMRTGRLGIITDLRSVDYRRRGASHDKAI